MESEWKPSSHTPVNLTYRTERGDRVSCAAIYTGLVSGPYTVFVVEGEGTIHRALHVPTESIISMEPR